MQKTAIQIGPQDNGRHMSLEDFDLAEGQPGYLYELSRGVITVMDVPNSRHLAQVDTIREQFSRYRTKHPNQIHRIAHGSDCKILLADLQSERHPDLAIYKTPPPEEENIWSTWVPEIVIEVVSGQSRHRDYEEKPEEYLQFGVKEYWILDAEKGEMLVHKRSRGRWSQQIIRPPKLYKTALLPEFEFSCALVLEAAEAD
jgi:Uma2 family endonuclease